MAEIVNLRLRRKRKERAEAESLAAANRLNFGRTKSEKRETMLEARRSYRELEARRLELEEK
jgi:hypothetical protein